MSTTPSHAPPAFDVVVMAAGQGTRMRSAVPKVLHAIAGRPIAYFPIAAALSAGARRVVVVVGHGRAAVESSLRSHFGERLDFAVQETQRGTGDAVRCGLAPLGAERGSPAATVVVLSGDVPLLPSSLVESLVRARTAETAVVLATSVVEDPAAYGRIVRDAAGRVMAIREHRDASDAELAIREVNPAVYAFERTFLADALEHLDPHNAQGELYLTDVIARAARDGRALTVSHPMEDLHGINDRWELAEAARRMRDRMARALAKTGVTLDDPATLELEVGVEVAPDVRIGPSVTLRGKTHVAPGAHLERGAVLVDTTVGARAHVKPYVVAERAHIGEEAEVGPFAHLRPGSELGANSKIGNFVETKNTRLGRGSKASHLAYLGDGRIGDGVNVGAGTIFCNYDGYQKHVTVLEDEVFIGSDSQLVAPVRVGRGSYVASGTTVVRDAPPDSLVLSRAPQVIKEGYASKIRAKLEAEVKAKKEAAKREK